MIAPELPFELQFIELAENRETIEMEPYIIDAYRVNHNVLCYGYSVRIPRKGKFDVERARASEIPQRVLEQAPERGGDRTRGAPPHA